jgi:sporulation protein YlmC with PRC-barrel domain
MTSLRGAIGKPVILRETAEQVGDVHFFAVNAADRQVTALVVAKGRRSSVIDWAQIQSVGPDAVIVEGTREPTSDDDRAVSGALHPIEKRVLSDRGNELGTTADIEIDDGGSIQTLHVADQVVDGTRLRGVGSYAVVVTADPDEG